MTPAPASRVVVPLAASDDALAGEARDQRLLLSGTQAVLFLLLVVGMLVAIPPLEDAFSSHVSITGLLITRMGTLAGVVALLRLATGAS